VIQCKPAGVFLLVVFMMAPASGVSGQNQSIPGSALLDPYSTCTFSDGLEVVKVDSLGPGIATREVDTAEGPRKIDMAAGIRIMFAYPNTDFYANAKAELLPSATYLEEKQWLVDSWKYLQTTSPGTTVNSALSKQLHGFEIQGFDRDKLEGGVLGLYLMFDNQRHVVATFYLLNQDPEVGKFNSIEGYRKLRDQFLETYTSCIRTNQTHQP
jgi:hypothetical protein